VLFLLGQKQKFDILRRIVLRSAYTKNRETKGTDTTVQSWVDRYAELAPGFADDLARIEQEYRAARQEVIA
jgi:hypothetical protein